MSAPEVLREARRVAVLAVSQSVTALALKNSVIMLPTRVSVCGTSAASRRRQALLPVGHSSCFQSLDTADRRAAPERRDAGRGRQRIAAERSGLKHFAGRQHVIHDLGRPP